MVKNNNIAFCFRCYHTWGKRKGGISKYCPRCKSPYWNRPRERISKGIVLKMQDTIISTHNTIIKISGGEAGIREEAGIYNSTYKLLNHINKNRRYPQKIGAFVLNEFAKRHYFVDGNKRTAYVLAKVFMLVNKCHLRVEYSEAIKFILEIAKHSSNLQFHDIEGWLENNCIIIEEDDVENYLNRVFVNITLGGEKND